jgi:hypothetical protein
MENSRADHAVNPSRLVQVLIEERKKLVEEIVRIDRVLAQEGVDVKSISAGIDAQLTPWGRPRNKMTKVEAMEAALKQADHPLTPRELLAAMQKLGYAFASARPLGTLNPYLYGKKKLDVITKCGRGFILTSRESEFEKKTR